MVEYQDEVHLFITLQDVPSGYITSDRLGGGEKPLILPIALTFLAVFFFDNDVPDFDLLPNLATSQPVRGRI